MVTGFSSQSQSIKDSMEMTIAANLYETGPGPGYMIDHQTTSKKEQDQASTKLD